jgi:two-component system LytT family sensor kinase
MRVSVQVEDGTLDALVPCMILQPVVENAIRHGISRDPRAGRVTIRAARRAEHIEIAVEDDGPGFAADLRLADASGHQTRIGSVAEMRFRPIYGNGRSDDGHGLGLLNTRLRLDALYGDRAQLRVGSADGAGARVEISLPYHTEPLVSDSEPARATHSNRQPASPA